MNAFRRLTASAAALLLSSASPAWSQARALGERDPDLAHLTASRVERFQGEADLRGYLRALTRIARDQGEGWAQSDKPSATGIDAAGVVIAGTTVSAPPPPPPPPPPALAAPPSPSPVVTGAVANQAAPAPQASANASSAETITNVQTHGVDEGDIVKRIGRFLIVLQDGRLFTVDTRGASGRLVFAGRVDVYRSPRIFTWYDEMLVYGHRVVVTGYSYQRHASEINVFTLGEDGQLTREAVYYMSSNDYYSINNYATRLVDDKLVVYTPLDLTNVDARRPFGWPMVRRWVRGEGDRAELTKGKPLFDARDIYRPLQPTLHPVVHSISVCPLGAARPGDELECHSTAFVGPPEREFYIAPDAAYLWTYGQGPDGACDPAAARRFEASAPATLYRAPFGPGEVGAMRVRGQPRDQLGLASTTHDFRALLFWNEARCGGPKETHQHLTLKYFSAPLSAFSTAPRAADASRYIDAPGRDDGMYEERFTDAYLVYGGRSSWSSYPPDNPPANGRVVALPLTDPRHATVLEAPHNIIRVEHVGPNFILTGYHNDDGLSISLLDLSAAPHIAATALLPHRYESEGRSHAFNAHLEDDQSGLLGLPTVYEEKQGGRFWWRSRGSDVSFLTLNHTAIAAAGELTVTPNGVDRSYQCEVSCVDWYGNSRAIFMDGRVFALTGTELIEGEMRDGRIRETQRLNLSVPPPARVAAATK